MKTKATHQRTSIRIATAVATLVAAAITTGAHAHTISVGNYTPIFQGISESGATVDGQFATILQINLDAPGVSFTTSPLCSGCTATAGGNVITKQTAAQFLTSSGVAVAITANIHQQ